MQETQETQVRFLGQEDTLEEKMAIHSRVYDWEIPWTEEPVDYKLRGCKESDMTDHTCMSPLQWNSGSLQN